MIESKPNILETLQREGMKFQKRGTKFYTSCFRHTDNTPSLMIDPKKGNAHCFSCGFHGDIINLVQVKNHLSFPEALAYLGITPKTLTKHLYEEIKANRAVTGKKKELLKAFRKWEQDFHNYVCFIYRTIERHLSLLTDLVSVTQQTDCLEWPYKTRSDMEFCLEILESNSDQLKYDLYRAVRQAGSLETFCLGREGGKHE